MFLGGVVYSSKLCVYSLYYPQSPRFGVHQVHGADGPNVLVILADV